MQQAWSLRRMWDVGAFRLSSLQCRLPSSGFTVFDRKQQLGLKELARFGYSGGVLRVCAGLVSVMKELLNRLAAP